MKINCQLSISFLLCPSIRTLIAKFFSSVTAVGSGLPVGPEGPMIHMGALVGAGVSQARSESLKFELPFFGRFRNSEDRYESMNSR